MQVGDLVKMKTNERLLVVIGLDDDCDGHTIRAAFVVPIAEVFEAWFLPRELEVINGR